MRSGCLERLYTLKDKGEMLAILLNCGDMLASSREEFQGDAPSTPKKVKRFEVFKVKVGTKYVEQVFLGEVCGGACLECAGNLKVFPLIESCDNTHRKGLFFSSKQEGYEIVRHALCGGYLVMLKVNRREDRYNVIGKLTEFTDERIA